MSRAFFLRLSLLVDLLVMFVALWALTRQYATLPERVRQHETLVLGQDRLTPGSRAALRVVVRETTDAQPLQHADITIALRPPEGGPETLLFSGVSDAQGTADVAFPVPDTTAGNQMLVITTRSALGVDTIERPVTIQRDYRILVSSDKPVYQPGQTIHLRTLSLATFDRTPAADQPLEITISDGKGNQVFRKTLTTSAYGVAATDFQLANEVNTGTYRITAALAGISSEKTVTVERYSLPKFETTITTERPYYQPGERVRGTLRAAYFYGKPVSGAQVFLEGATFDVERNVAVTLRGTTSADGIWAFEFDLPPYVAGSELDQGRGRFSLQADVTDRAQQTVTKQLTLPVAQTRLVIEAVAEGGQLRPGLENRLYVLTSYPDGTPAATTIELQAGSGLTEAITAQTGEYGLATVRFTPNETTNVVRIHAQDTSGAQVTRDISFALDTSGDAVLLRPDRPHYRAGDTMRLTLLTRQPGGTVYLDLIREGQTVSTRAVPIQNGQAEVAVDLTPDLYGSLQLHAYKVLEHGNFARDTRLVLVDDASQLDLSLTTDRATYRPGETAGLDVAVRGAEGGVQAALGLAAVDEAVFSVAESDPGFARLYFLLERELLQPKYELHGFRVPDLLDDTPLEPVRDSAQQDAARASLALAAADVRAHSIEVNSHDEALSRVDDLRRAKFDSLGRGLLGAILLLPLAMLCLSFMLAARDSDASVAFGTACTKLVAGGAILLPVSCIVIAVAWQLATLLGVLLVSAGVGWLLFVLFRAITSRDPLREWLAWLSIVYFGTLGFLIYTASWTPGSFGFGSLLLILSTFGTMLIALVMVAPNSTPRVPTNSMLPIVGVSLLLGAAILTACGGAPSFSLPSAESSSAASAPTSATTDSTTQGGAAPDTPRLRQSFPETMLWVPDATADAQGNLHLDVPLADSITTWRVTALASTQDGRLASTTSQLRVFQDFFVDLDLPQALTVDDEVALPVGVFNYLPNSQSVRLQIESAPWFELLDEPQKELTIAANDISVVYFRIRARAAGQQMLNVTAHGSQMSDAIQKQVRVFPNGKQITFTSSDQLNTNAPVRQTIAIPADALPGSSKLTVKVYPGVVSQVVEGLDSILRMPYGCFEQTSSTTYPNVLILDYLRATKQASPETQLTAEAYINQGYQRLMTFEVDGGGFSLFGDPPADLMLTAYGLQEFSDMQRVHPVDPALIQRTADWLLAQQQSDGSWDGREHFHESMLTGQSERLPVTAYVLWSLIDAGYDKDENVRRGIDYLRQHQAEAIDPYVLGLLANALVAADERADAGISAATRTVLERLAKAAVDGSWQTKTGTSTGGYGETGDIETTALAALALLRAHSHPDLANDALLTLVRAKDSFGTWHNTSATVMALKALLESVRTGSEQINATITVTLDGAQAQTIAVTPETFDVVQLVTFDDVRPGSVVELNANGVGGLMYQIGGEYYVPWTSPAAQATPETAQPVSIDVSYDRAALTVNDTVTATVTVRLNQPGSVDQTLLDLGVPPGFALVTEDLDALTRHAIAQGDAGADASPAPATTGTAGQARIERYERTARQLLLYVTDLSSDAPLTFSYRLRARLPLTAQTPSSTAYDYYNPAVAGQSAPTTLVVKP